MKAARVTAPGEFRVERVPLPRPGPGEIRIRLAGCGVCASNLGPWSGAAAQSLPAAPGGLGHEGWGIVDALGDGVTHLRPGDRVAALFQHSYAEYDVGAAGEIVALPDDLDGLPFPGEPFACAMNIFRRSGIRAGDTVAIVGVGFIGAILTRLAASEGARVIALSRRPFALRMAQAMGAAETIQTNGRDNAVERVAQITGGELCDCVVEATGKQAPLDLAAELTRVRGRLVVAGYHQDGERRVNMQMWNWRGLDVVNAHERDPAVYVQGMKDAVAAVQSGRIDPAPLLTHVYPLEKLGEALDATRDRPDGFLKAVVTVEQ